MGLLGDHKAWKDANRDEARAVIPLAFVSDLTIRSLKAVPSKLDVETYAKFPQPQVALQSGQKFNASSIYTTHTIACASWVLQGSCNWKLGNHYQHTKNG